MGWVDCVFFFKQKTAYEMLRSLVGSEMCIRDRTRIASRMMWLGSASKVSLPTLMSSCTACRRSIGSVSYTHLTLPTIYSV